MPFAASSRRKRALFPLMAYCILWMFFAEDPPRFLVLPLVDAAAYNSYQYDMTTPQYTPDGRLLQVEYAQAATERSTPTILVSLSADLLLLCTYRVSSTPGPRDDKKDDASSTTTTTPSSNEDESSSLRRRPSSLTPYTPCQQRLVVLEENDCVVALSGVLADNLALLRHVAQESMSRQRRFGIPLTAAQVVERTASICQQHAFGGGIRPFGASLLVCGVDPYGNHGRGRLQLWQTDPSGAIRTVTPPKVGEARVLGSSRDAAKLQILLNNNSNTNNNRKKIALVERVREITICIQQSATEHMTSSGAKEGTVILEAVLVSTTSGIFPLRLDKILSQATPT